jgi:hypothetical protein
VLSLLKLFTYYTRFGNQHRKYSVLYRRVLLEEAYKCLKEPAVCIFRVEKKTTFFFRTYIAEEGKTNWFNGDHTKASPST